MTKPVTIPVVRAAIIVVAVLASGWTALVMVGGAVDLWRSRRRKL